MTSSIVLSSSIAIYIYILLSTALYYDIGDSMNLVKNLFKILIIIYRRLWFILLIFLVLFGKNDYNDYSFIIILLANVAVSLAFIPIINHKSQKNIVISADYFNENFYIIDSILTTQNVSWFICQSNVESLTKDSEKCYILRSELYSDDYIVINSYKNLETANKYFYDYSMYN